VQGFLHKPFHSNDLAGAVRAALDRARNRPDDRGSAAH